jgi:hypothetical protein
MEKNSAHARYLILGFFVFAVYDLYVSLFSVCCGFLDVGEEWCWNY